MHALPRFLFVLGLITAVTCSPLPVSSNEDVATSSPHATVDNETAEATEIPTPALEEVGSHVEEVVLPHIEESPNARTENSQEYQLLSSSTYFRLDQPVEFVLVFRRSDSDAEEASNESGAGMIETIGSTIVETVEAAIDAGVDFAQDVIQTVVEAVELMTETIVEKVFTSELQPSDATDVTDDALVHDIVLEQQETPTSAQDVEMVPSVMESNLSPKEETEQTRESDITKEQPTSTEEVIESAESTSESAQPVEEHTTSTNASQPTDDVANGTPNQTPRDENIDAELEQGETPHAIDGLPDSESEQPQFTPESVSTVAVEDSIQATLCMLDGATTTVALSESESSLSVTVIHETLTRGATHALSCTLWFNSKVYTFETSFVWGGTTVRSLALDDLTSAHIIREPDGTRGVWIERELTYELVAGDENIDAETPLAFRDAVLFWLAPGRSSIVGYDTIGKSLFSQTLEADHSLNIELLQGEYEISIQGNHFDFELLPDTVPLP